MQNPQLEEGFLRIANEIVDHLCSYRISGEEWQVLLVVLRKTYGWNKKEDFISITQFQQITGLKRANVYRAIKKLLSKKIIAIIKKDNSQVNSYCFNKLYCNWVTIIKRDNSSSRPAIIKKDNTLLSKKITKVLSKKIPTIYNKDTITKDNIYTPIKIIKNKYSSVEDVKEVDFIRISEEYKVSLGFVKLQWEKLNNWCVAKGKKYKDYKHALRNWVLMDMQRQIERRGDNNKRGVDARNVV